WGAIDGQFALNAYAKLYAWAMNLETGAMSKYDDFDFYALSGDMGADGAGLYRLSGTTDNGTAIPDFVQTGKLDFGKSELKRVIDYYQGVDGGPFDLTVTTETGTST